MEVIKNNGSWQKRIDYARSLNNKFYNQLGTKLENHLELMNDFYKINFLQYCRYSLLDEKIAYEEGSKYFIHATNSKNYFFDEKIKMIENLIKETINNVRKNQK